MSSSGEMTEQEEQGLSQAFKIIEDLLKKHPDKVNLLLLMMVDHQIHYHFIPRYEKKVDFDGQTYVDEDWSKPLNAFNFILLYNESLKEIHQHLITHL